ncbi:MAG TPA: hypothetical protein VHS34_06745 [Terriglobales bacterium]|jgi:multisubunit Na+/H+ antiporter MnhB subunit|nr:hypothetical protein [Terriglobales bacterium]
MESDPEPGESPRFLKSSASLIVAVTLVLILLAWLPAYRWFFLISLGVGVIVAGILYLWNKHRPIKEKDIENKHPLGLG